MTRRLTMTTNEILGWLCSHLLAFGAGMSLGFGFHLMMLLFAGAAIISVVLLHGILYEEAVTPSHSSYDVDDEYLPCTECDGVGKVYLLGAMGATATCPQCRGTGRVYNDDYFIF